MAKQQPTQQNQHQKQQGTMNTNKQTDQTTLNKNKWQQGGTTGGAQGGINNQGKGGFGQQQKNTNLGGGQVNRGGFGGTDTDRNRQK